MPEGQAIARGGGADPPWLGPTEPCSYANMVSTSRPMVSTAFTICDRTGCREYAQAGGDHVLATAARPVSDEAHHQQHRQPLMQYLGRARENACCGDKAAPGRQ